MRSIAVWFALRYMRFFAWIALLIHRPIVIGIAGSVGKSSTKYILQAILADHGKTVVTSGNSETGVPLGILGIKLKGYSFFNWFIAFIRCPLGVFHLVGVKYLIVEMGIDDPFPPKNMGYLLSIVKPEIAVIINESATHTMQFEKTLREEELNISAERKRDLLIRRITFEDMKMVMQKNCHTAVYNSDDLYVAEDMKRVHPRVKQVSFGSKSSNVLSYAGYDVTLEKSVFDFDVKDERVHIELTGYVMPKEYREVFGAAILTAYTLGLSLDTIRDSIIKNHILPKGRASIFRGINDTVILDSSYNASRTSTLAFLTLVSELKQKMRRPVVFAFGDMRELGQEAEQEHIAVAERIPGVVDYLYCIGPLTKQFIVPFAEKAALQEVQWFENSRLLGSHLRAHLPNGAIVLVKGSQNQIFLEVAIKFILANEKDKEKLCRQEKHWNKE